VDPLLSDLLISTLSSVLRLDPSIIYTSSAMDITFHFLLTVPSNPNTRFLLSDTVDFSLQKLWSTPGHRDSPKEMEWFAKVVEMVNIASQRQKGDPLTVVSHPFYRLLLRGILI
jgi:hypothetical protein